jgi:hypothetical protein
VIAQWTWNLRLELGHQLKPHPLRTTEFAPALPPPAPHSAPASGYTPPEVGSAWKVGRVVGQDFALQPDGTLQCPADQTLIAHEHRREVDGSLRIDYASQHPQWSSLSVACAMPVAWEPDLKAAPGECAVASSSGRFGASPLA